MKEGSQTLDERETSSLYRIGDNWARPQAINLHNLHKSSDVLLAHEHTGHLALNEQY